MSMILVIGRFFGPFAILLLRSIKKHPHQLCYVAAWIVLMQMLDIAIVVLPALHARNRRAREHFGILFPLGSQSARHLGFVYLKRILYQAKPHFFLMRDPRLIESLKLTNW